MMTGNRAVFSDNKLFTEMLFIWQSYFLVLGFTGHGVSNTRLLV